MNAKIIVALTVACTLLPNAAEAGRGGGRMGGARMGGMSRSSMSRPSNVSRPSGGFSMPADAPKSGSGTRTNTGPGGTTRTTNYAYGENGYARTTTASNGDYSRTSGGAYNANSGNFAHGTSSSGAYGNRTGSTTGNVNSGNFSHNASGGNGYGSYNTSGSGNAYNRTYNGQTNASNVWGQTYHSNTSINNGTVYRGAVVTNPVYVGYPVYGWNYGYPWYPAPYYWGGGFWGSYAVGYATGAAYGEVTNEENEKVESYEVAQDTPGAKLLESYKLTQTPCGPSDLVVIYGPNNSAICAKPNDLVAAGNYSVDEKNLTLVSEKPAS